MFSARQNWSTVKVGSLNSGLARFALPAGLCSRDTFRLHACSYVGPCINVYAEKIRAEIFRRLGRRVLIRFVSAAPFCPLAPEVTEVLRCRIDGMCHGTKPLRRHVIKGGREVARSWRPCWRRQTMLYRRDRVLFFCMEVEQPEWLQHIGILLPAAPNDALFQAAW